MAKTTYKCHAYPSPSPRPETAKTRTQGPKRERTAAAPAVPTPKPTRSSGGGLWGFLNKPVRWGGGGIGAFLLAMFLVHAAPKLLERWAKQVQADQVRRQIGEQTTDDLVPAAQASPATKAYVRPAFQFDYPASWKVDENDKDYDPAHYDPDHLFLMAPAEEAPDDAIVVFNRPFRK